MKRDNEHAERAKQFMPFDALRGFREALREKERVIVPHVELNDDAVELLNRKLALVRQNDIITVVYFSNGTYLQCTGMVSKIDRDAQFISVVKQKIPFTDIYDLTGGALPDGTET